MLAYLFVSHGNLGRELVKAAELIIGEQRNYECLGLFHNDSVSELQGKIKEKVSKLQCEEGLIVFTDIFGGSPANAVMLALREEEYKCITGMNLPMVLEAFLVRDYANSEEIAVKCQVAGLSGIKELGEELAKENFC